MSRACSEILDRRTDGIALSRASSSKSKGTKKFQLSTWPNKCTVVHQWRTSQHEWRVFSSAPVTPMLLADGLWLEFIDMSDRSAKTSSIAVSREKERKKERKQILSLAASIICLRLSLPAAVAAAFIDIDIFRAYSRRILLLLNQSRSVANTRSLLTLRSFVPLLLVSNLIRVNFFLHMSPTGRKPIDLLFPRAARLGAPLATTI